MYIYKGMPIYLARTQGGWTATYQVPGSPPVCVRGRTALRAFKGLLQTLRRFRQ